jgi:hypothetical protein
MTFYTWSTTAASNATADATINWAENQAPSTINNSSRAEMAAVAKARNDWSGTLTTGGTSTAYTLTTNQVFTTAALMSGAMICFIPHATNGASPTLAVDGLTARAINVSTGVAVSTGALLICTPYVVTYIHATTEFILQGTLAALTNLTLSGNLTVSKTETLKDGGTIASAASLTLGDGNLFRVSGTTTITSIGTKGVGTHVWLRFDGALTLTHNGVTLHLLTATSIVTEALDWALFEEYGVGNWQMLAYHRHSGAQLGATFSGTTVTASGALSGGTATGAMVATQAQQETGTAVDFLVTPGRQHFHASAAKALVKFNSAGTVATSYNITSVTDVGTGLWTVNIATVFSSADYYMAGLIGTFAAGLQPIILNINAAAAAGTVNLQADNIGQTESDPTTPDAIYAVFFGDQ